MDHCRSGVDALKTSGAAGPAISPVGRPEVIRQELSLDRLLAHQALSRMTGSATVPGNRLRLLKDGPENYPAWLQAIAGARRSINFENYIIRNDATGRMFAAALAERARAGVTVRLIYDWLGNARPSSHGLLAGLRRAGVDVRCFNPPRLDSPFGWLSRDHRKMVSVDGRIGFVAGLCVGDLWQGDPARGIEPWRDTGVQIEGPAVADLDLAFAHSWAAAIAPRLAPVPDPPPPPPAGDVAVRLIEGQPAEMAVYRVDLLVAAGVQRSLWITDAYFVGTTVYIQALTEAARDGVDVRLLVPGTSDLPLTQAVSRATFRPLLEAGVRIFEWNGPMLHAKTAVADGKWARIGSTNLNMASWIGNWELDLAIEHAGFARQMEDMYLADLERSTELVLGAHRRPQAAVAAPASRGRRDRRRSAARVAAGAVGIGSTIGAAMTNRRHLGASEAAVLAGIGAGLLLLLGLGLLLPRLVMAPFGLIGCWIAVALLARAWSLYRARDRGEGPQNK